MSRWFGRRATLCICALVLCWISAGSRIAGGEEPAKYHLQITSQPLDPALQEFARQSGIQVIYFSRITAGVQAPALDGYYTLQGAVQALLINSKLTFRVINPKTVEIKGDDSH